MQPCWGGYIWVRQNNLSYCCCPICLNYTKYIFILCIWHLFSHEQPCRRKWKTTTESPTSAWFLQLLFGVNKQTPSCSKSTFVFLKGNGTSFIFLEYFSNHMFSSETRMTLRHPDYYNWKKVCAIVTEGEGQLAEGAVSQKHFEDLMTMHIKSWYENRENFKVKKPVKNIGLQVLRYLYNLCNFNND